ncbi:MAG: MFS transporter [Nitrosomonadales bacterium]
MNTCSQNTLHATCPAASSVAQTPTRRLSGRAAFYLLASITVSFLAGSLAPTPLYPVYQTEWGFSALSVTEIFGIYALALLGSLLLVGRLSDHIGRKPVLIVATIVQALVMLMFATANGEGSLLLARIIQGLATGAALGAVGAGMLDLDKTRGPVANAVAPPLGTGLGGLLSGLFVYYLPAPTVLIYAVLAAVFLLQALGLIFMVETVSRKAGAIASLKPQLSVPAATREPLIFALPILVAVWSLAGFYGSLVPALLHKIFGFDPSIASGLAALALAGSAAVAVLVLQRWEPRKVMNYGTIAVMSGATLVVFSLSLQSAVVFFLGTIVAGTGFGAGFQGAVRTVIPTAKAHERAGVLSVIFVVSYLAMGIPAIVAGYFVAQLGNLLITAQVFGAAVVTLAGFAFAGEMAGRKG